MNAEQKQRMAHELGQWNAAMKSSCSVSDLLAISTRMPALLQELIDAPEPEPVGYTNETELDYVRKYEALPVSGAFWPTSDEDACVALYTSPPAKNQSEQHLEMVNAPAPSVPDGWRLVPYTPTVLMLERAEYAVNNRPQPSKYEPSATPAIIFWTAMLNYAPEAPTPAEAQADVARDAERLDWLDERNAPHGLGWEIIQMPAGNVHIHTLTGDKAKFGSIRDAIDAAMSEKGGKA